MAKTIMVQGTMSNVGKSLLTAGLCRIFAEDGYSVAPFKSQNMALNSFITPDGLEIGRAQAMQAEASFKDADVRMNPILLKPTGDKSSQVIVNGEVKGVMTATEYFKYKSELLPEISKAYTSLASENDIIVIEGAGSPAEINLNSNDIVNMGMAKLANSPVLLVGDIDRGGVFATLYGTVKLLNTEEQSYIKGIIINKFRGDVSLLKSGLDMIYDLLNINILGVVPSLDIDIDDEDSLSERLTLTERKGIDIAVIKLPHISNFTDFNPFERIQNVSLRYISCISKLGAPDLIILPGTKNTMADLRWLKNNGLADEILQFASSNKPIIGICGGYQMLCKKLSDPHNVEHGGDMLGLGLIDAETIFAKNKIRTRVKGLFRNVKGVFENLTDKKFEGYEIHMGETIGNDYISTIVDSLGNERADGMNIGNIYGTYVHGIFDSNDILNTILQKLGHLKGIELQPLELESYKYKELQYTHLANELRKNLDIKEIYNILNKGV